MAVVSPQATSAESGSLPDPRGGPTDYRILGPLEVDDDGVAVPLGGGKERTLLALLLVYAGELLSADRLIDELWGHSPPASATKMVQVYVSRLRKVLPRDTLLTRPPGYVLRVEPGDLDLERFERLAGEGHQALAEGMASHAAEVLREALGLWRGAPLADFVYEPFAQQAIARLEELRLGCLEQWADAELELGRHAPLVPELERLVRSHPFRERLRGQLMLALYRAGRQAEALETYQDTRRAFVEELGIEPSPTLQRLEKAILVHDPSLEPAAVPPSEAGRAGVAAARSILVAVLDAGRIGLLLELAVPLTLSRAPHELIVLRFVPPGEAGALSQAVAETNDLRSRLLEQGVPVRTATLTSADPTGDTARLASDHAVDLALLDCPDNLLAGEAPSPALAALLDKTPCHVGLVAARDVFAPGPILVPFGGGEHDWAALELGAWMASACGVPLRLAGTVGDEPAGKRDASRLLASASLAVQHVAGVTADPLLIEPGAQSILAAAREAGLLVLGLSARFSSEGLGPARLRLATSSPAPVVLVRRGLRPSGLAPPDSSTRFTWSLGAASTAGSRASGGTPS